MPYSYLAIAVALFVFICLRYFIIAGLFHQWFYVIRQHKWSHRRLGKKQPAKQQFYTEIKWSLITSVIFAITGAAMIVLWENGYTKIYTEIHSYPLWYLPVSFLAAMLVHETYYYFLHRWMHRPGVFKLFHKIHHNSHTTSAWTAFSFHPLEGLLQALIIPLILLVLPMHWSVLLLQLTVMTFTSVINHLEIEVYPEWLQRSVIGRWLIGATHHSLHHKKIQVQFRTLFHFLGQMA